MIQISTTIFIFLIGVIGTLLGMLIINFWLQPKVVANHIRTESNTNSIKDLWDIVNGMRNQINEIHREVVKNKNK